MPKIQRGPRSVRVKDSITATSQRPMLLESSTWTRRIRTTSWMYAGKLPETCPMYASGPRDTSKPSNEKTMSGSWCRLLQPGPILELRRCTNASTASEGMTRREVPLSMTAPQPPAQPDNDMVSSPAGTGSRSERCTPAMCTVQVCFPTTGRRWKSSGCSRAVASFQTRKPLDPGRFPKQTEKLRTSKLESNGLALLICSAMERSWSACETR
mmetsp:Transcript_34514/g.107195  ORF Transcript_34514/g.107195 Transcript_34514/m.107195 type:complete len:212 (-) Transcript_34514:1495-2130(-)